MKKIKVQLKAFFSGVFSEDIEHKPVAKWCFVNCPHEGILLAKRLHLP